jgi:hypothetical protein
MMEIPRVLIHVGRPDAELPHKSLVRIEKMFEKYPSAYFVCVVWEEADAEYLKVEIAKLKRPENQAGFEVIHWKTDATLMDYLCGNLHRFMGAKIVSPGWYVCAGKDAHVSPRSMDKMLEKCPECGEGVAYKTEFTEKFQEFAMVFSRVTNLINFDTRSGEALNTMVNPTTNVLFNMPYAMPVENAKAVDMTAFKDIGKGRPAYLVSAGPTLEDALPHLKRLQDTGLILCVGRSYKLLREYGIRVDFTFSCEMFDWDAVIFDGVEKEDHTVMCYPPVVAPATVRKWPGKRCCMWDMNTSELIGRKDYIVGGNSVSHHMFNFCAQILGSEPIVFVGLDYSYPKPRTHAKGTFHKFSPEAVVQDEGYHTQERWAPSNGKGELHEGCHQIECDPRKAAPIGPVQVRTSQPYLDFAVLHEILISRHGKKCLNASGPGLKVAGAPYVDLATYAP